MSEYKKYMKRWEAYKNHTMIQIISESAWEEARKGYVKLEDIIEILEAEYEHIPFHIIEAIKALEVKNESR